jgi:archaeal type IV pilus assembly protein PilA
MNYNKIIRKFKKNSKGLSPVVASIILIAVTVAVSVVVAAWMGGMTIGLMGNAEQISVTNIGFDGATNTITVMVQNAAGANSNITNAFVNGVAATMNAGSTNVGLPKSSTVTISLTGTTLGAGTSYSIKLITAKGTSVVNTATYNP